MPVPHGPGNPVSAREVRAMFDRIAPIYDAMNTAMTLGLDARWRRAACRAAGLGPGMSAADIACGSGALTRELARAVGTAGRVVGFDVAPRMLARARRRPARPKAAVPDFRRADALALPLDDGSVDAATIAFGLRNVSDYGRCLAEMVRVTRPGGRIVVLEIATPRGRVGRFLAATWLDRVVPLLGRLAGGASAYRYLPASVRGYPPPETIAGAMRDSGIAGVRWGRLAPGLVTLHVGERR